MYLIDFRPMGKNKQGHTIKAFKTRSQAKNYLSDLVTAKRLDKQLCCDCNDSLCGLDTNENITLRDKNTVVTIHRINDANTELFRTDCKYNLEMHNGLIKAAVESMLASVIELALSHDIHADLDEDDIYDTIFDEHIVNKVISLVKSETRRVYGCVYPKKNIVKPVITLNESEE